MNKQDKNDLVERLEKAEGGSRELDDSVVIAATNGEMMDWWDEKAQQHVTKAGDGSRVNVTPVTTSLDAALALAERVLPGWNWTMAAPSRSRKVRDRFFARVETPDFDCVTWEAGDKYTTDVLAGRDAAAYAASPALALCIAILRASNPMNEGGESA